MDYNSSSASARKHCDFCGAPAKKYLETNWDIFVHLLVYVFI